MPLLKGKPFFPIENPDDLNSEELVFQIRFTKEIFRSYDEYLKRINLYRKRVWTCKATGKENLTYEEALLSEENASKRRKSVPAKYVAPILREVQFSMLNLNDLVSAIASKFQGPLSVGDELYGRKDGRLHPCKIVDVIEVADRKQYEIEWMGDEQKTRGNAIVSGDELTEKNLPFSKQALKSFIKESTYRSLPWVLQDNLSKKHGISTIPPGELKSNISIENGINVCNKKRKKTDEAQSTEVTSEKEIIVYVRRSKLASSLVGRSKLTSLLAGNSSDRDVIEVADRKQYEIEWIGDEQKTRGNAFVSGDELTEKNPPFSKRALKSFIKESTYRSLPWVLHDNLSKKHGISTIPPGELKSNISIENGIIVCNKKRKKTDEAQSTKATSAKEIIVYVRRSKLTSSLAGKSSDRVNQLSEDQSSRYPVDDLLVQPTAEDRLLLERPSPCRDFNVPMECVGDLLMVWDFCTSFGRLLNLSPFSLENFESSLCYKDSTPMLIVESCSSLLRLLVKDNEKFSMVVKNRNRRPKITQITWTEYLSDFLETISGTELSADISTIKRGHYALLETHIKLGIFRELVAQALETETVKDRLDEYIEEGQALSATRRDEALDEGRKRREEKERRKAEAARKGVKEEHREKSVEGTHNGDIHESSNNDKVLSQPNHSSGSSENEGDGTTNKNSKKRKVEMNTASEDVNHPSKRVIHKLMKNEIKETIEMKSAKERIEFLEREIEKRFIRTSPLGKDRNYCRYWFFRRDGRIFVESSDSTQWGYYQTKEEVDDLIGSMNTKGVRERALKKQLEKFYSKICSELQKRSKEAEQMDAMEEALVRRSTRVRAPPGENPTHSFLNYVNKWKDIDS